MDILLSKNYFRGLIITKANQFLWLLNFLSIFKQLGRIQLLDGQLLVCTFICAPIVAHTVYRANKGLVSSMVTTQFVSRIILQQLPTICACDCYWTGFIVLQTKIEVVVFIIFSAFTSAMHTKCVVTYLG